MARASNPLEPISTAIKAIITVIAVLLAAGVLGAMTQDGVHFRVLGIGDKNVCASDTSTTVGGGEVPPQELQAAPGATVDMDAHPNYCTDDPTTPQSLLNIAKQIPSALFTVGALLLALWLIRGAQGEGLFTARTAYRLRMLGWWLLAGSVLSAVATSVAEQALVGSLSRSDDAGALTGLLIWNAPYMALLTGLGVLSFARVMRIGITMREELDGTV
ncbi:DUF2975 domain-containing protein [Streptomyces sp. NPDC005244]|uniref:DUF2975 domain-containing protein n=1 Tax=Streptomyces sp. NPDC005244 TaxID=3364708 RepID=UPI00367E37BE